jgi:hypothetical protein
MKHLIVGYGEIGQSIRQVLGNYYREDEVEIHDAEQGYVCASGRMDIVHICFPPSPKFVEFCKGYADLHGAGLTIIHSSVPVGTSKKLQQVCGHTRVVYSPVRGVHPNIYDGIMTFPKYFGSSHVDGAYQACAVFRKCGVKSVPYKGTSSLEAAKLWDTTQYGLMIVIEKLIHKYCKENSLDFNMVYTEWNKTYNEGYMELGKPNVVRPYLKHMKGEIGGHCVLPNAELLNTYLGTWLLNLNKELSEE